MSQNTAKPDAFAAVVRHYENGTAEVRQLLDRECEMLYECR